MAPNYGYIFMDKFEARHRNISFILIITRFFKGFPLSGIRHKKLTEFSEMLTSNFIQTSLSPLISFRFIDDIFFILTSDKESLHDLIQFVQGFSEKSNMKSKIKFDVNISENSLNFLDVILDNGTLEESSDD